MATIYSTAQPQKAMAATRTDTGLNSWGGKTKHALELLEMSLKVITLKPWFLTLAATIAPWQ
jgi:hypothetical protein